MERFEIGEDFILNGKKIKLISGGMHYFRVVPEYWRDRLEKIKALGCNCVETYVAWNVHEPKKGQFNFSGMADLGKFIKLAQELGLYVIVRPSPYICAEWELGGLPAWLIADYNMHLRSNYEPYMKHVREYYHELFKILTPLQVTHGGPIIMFQVENEYGAYGEDTSYLVAMRDLMIECGVDVPFISSDGPWDDYLSCGEIPGVLQSANFGSKGHEQFGILRKKIGNKPLMCMEFWVGWFDAWGDEKHHIGDPYEHAKDLDEILSEGSVNIYLVIGGTNWGFMNGSNYYDVLTPDVTSYDYDALLTEDGQVTEKYKIFQEIIGKYTELPEVKLSTEIKRKEYGSVELKESMKLFDALPYISEPVKDHYPVTMEKIGQSYGYILYRSQLIRDREISKIRLLEANDRAKFYLDQKEFLTLYDRELLSEHQLSEKLTGDRLDILVENMGRVNYGAMMERQQKGIKQAVLINAHQHYDWEHFALPMDNLDRIPFDGKAEIYDQAAFYRFTFNVDEKADTFLDTTGFGKGTVVLNGFILGRFWEIGPQRKLYIPGPLLRDGENEIIIFETEGKAVNTVTLSDTPGLE